MKALMAMVGDNIDPWLPHTTKEDWEFEDSLLDFKHHLYIPEVAHHQLVQGAWGILLYSSLASEGLLVARNVCTPPKIYHRGCPVSVSQGQHPSYNLLCFLLPPSSLTPMPLPLTHLHLVFALSLHFFLTHCVSP